MRVHSDLEKAILRTLIWFGLHKHPVTVFELHKWLLQPQGTYELAQVQRALMQSSWLLENIQTHQGMYALKGSDRIKDLVARRRTRFIDAERKFKALRRWSHWLRALPSVRALAVGNTLAWWGTGADSDIDLFVIVEPGKIWSTRLLSTLPFAVLGKRPHTGAQDPFCLSFFATTTGLQLESLCLERDVYMAYWVKSLVPVFDRAHHMSELHDLNRWASSSLPHAKARQVHHRHAPARLPALIKQARFMEAPLRAFQRSRLPKTLKDMANTDTRVALTDTHLKFHTNDRRAQFRDAYEAQLARYL